MVDDIGDALGAPLPDELTGGDVIEASDKPLLPGRPTPSALAVMAHNLAPLADALRMALAESEQTFALSLAEATPAQREEVNRLRAILAALVAPVQGRLAALDQHALIAATRIGADELPLPKGRAITIRRSSGPTYQTDAPALWHDLVALCEKGLVTDDEVEAAVTTTVEHRANHTTLNRLYRHRGEAVQEAIDRHRHRLPPDPRRGRVEWPEPLREEEET